MAILEWSIYRERERERERVLTDWQTNSSEVDVKTVWNSLSICHIADCLWLPMTVPNNNIIQAETIIHFYAQDIVFFAHIPRNNTTAVYVDNGKRMISFTCGLAHWFTEFGATCVFVFPTSLKCPHWDIGSYLKSKSFRIFKTSCIFPSVQKCGPRKLLSSWLVKNKWQ